MITKEFIRVYDEKSLCKAKAKISSLVNDPSSLPLTPCLYIAAERGLVSQIQKAFSQCQSNMKQVQGIILMLNVQSKALFGYHGVRFQPAAAFAVASISSKMFKTLSYVHMVIALAGADFIRLGTVSEFGKHIQMDHT